MHPWEMTRKLATVVVVFERQKAISRTRGKKICGFPRDLERP
jgi:hypothetical protein